MDDATLRNQIGSNIAAYRKQAGLTQAGLAGKKEYFDQGGPPGGGGAMGYINREKHEFGDLKSNF